MKTNPKEVHERQQRYVDSIGGEEDSGDIIVAQAFVQSIRDLAGGALIMLPSSVLDFANPEIRAIIEKTQRSASMDPEHKVKFMKAAWDAIGSEFGSRHMQYEMFYAGARFVTTGHSFRTYDWNGATALVEALLASYDLDDALRTAAQ